MTKYRRDNVGDIWRKGDDGIWRFRLPSGAWSRVCTRFSRADVDRAYGPTTRCDENGRLLPRKEPVVVREATGMCETWSLRPGRNGLRWYCDQTDAIGVAGVRNLDYLVSMWGPMDVLKWGRL